MERIEWWLRSQNIPYQRSRRQQATTDSCSITDFMTGADIVRWLPSEARPRLLEMMLTASRTRHQQQCKLPLPCSKCWARSILGLSLPCWLKFRAMRASMYSCGIFPPQRSDPTPSRPITSDFDMMQYTCAWQNHKIQDLHKILAKKRDGEQWRECT